MAREATLLIRNPPAREGHEQLFRHLKISPHASFTDKQKYKIRCEFVLLSKLSKFRDDSI